MEAQLKPLAAERFDRASAPPWFRLLGLLPLAFFIAHGVYYYRNGGLPHLLWMCNIGNLALSIGMLTGRPVLIRMATIWLIPGLFLWFFFVVLRGGWLLTSTVAHVGGLAVGLYALYKVRADRRTWLYALVWYVAMQQVCRWVTPPELNVNVATKIYDMFETTFSDIAFGPLTLTAYFQFWVVTTLMVAAGLWLLGFLLWKIWPLAEEAGA